MYKILLFAFAALSAVFLSQDTSATTIHVPGDQPTIQAGIDAAVDGDTVLVAPGTYTENNDFKGKLIVLRSFGGPEVTTIQASNATQPVVSMVTGEPKGTKITGFTISGSSYSGIFCNESSPAIVGNIVENNSSNNDNTSPGIDLNSTTSAVVWGNVIRNNIAHTYGPAIHTEITSVDDTIAYNVIYGNSGYFEIRCLANSTRLQVYNNTVKASIWSGMTFYVGGGTVRNNIVFNAPHFGIYADRGGVTAEYNCTFDNATDYNFVPGTGNIYTDALFVDPSSSNYGLDEMSPCIDAGHPDPFYNDPDTTRNDMGALYFDQGPDYGPIIHVSPSGNDDTGDGTFEEPFATIQHAVDVSGVGDTVMVLSGTYNEHVQVVTRHALTLLGVSGETSVVSDTSRCITAQACTSLVLEDLSFEGDVYEDSLPGGALLLDSCVALCTGCVVSNSRARWRAGGIYSRDSRLLLHSCIVSSNEVLSLHEDCAQPTHGGGIWASGTLIVDTGCVIAGNFSVSFGYISMCAGAGYGGGIYFEGDSLFVRSTSVRGNMGTGAAGSGGGIWAQADWYQITDCVISENRGGAGGRYGVYTQGGGACLYGSGEVYDCSIDSNKIGGATGFPGETMIYGGGIYAAGASISLSNNSFIGNKLQGEQFDHGSWVFCRGGGVYLECSDSGLFADNSIVETVVEAVHFGGFLGSRSEAYGGGAYLSGPIEIAGNVFAYNSLKASLDYASIDGIKVLARGGGCYIVGPSTLQISENTAANNSVEIALEFPGETEFPDHSYVCSGGGIYVDSSEGFFANLLLSNSGLATCAQMGFGNICSDSVFGSGAYIGAVDTAYCNLLYQNVGGEEWSGNWPELQYYQNPLICYGEPGNDYFVSDVSPCLPVNNDCGIQIGARGEGCVWTPSAGDVLLNSEESLHCVSHTPEITWSFDSPIPAAQDSFEIAVGVDNNWSHAEMWNPAPFFSPDTFIQYAGLPLLDGETYYARVRVHNSYAWSEWANLAFHMNSVPSLPQLSLPIDSGTVGDMPWLWLHNATDAEADALVYDFLWARDTAFGTADTLVEFNVAEGTDSTGWQVNPVLTENDGYVWTARSYDGYEYSDWSPSRFFLVNASNEAPSVPLCASPPSRPDSILHDMKPTFSWGESVDPDPMDTVWYRLRVALDPAFDFASTVEDLEAPAYLWHDSLDFDDEYWWTVAAYDRDGLTVWATDTLMFYTWTLGDVTHDHIAELTDVLTMASAAFLGGPPIEPAFIGDVTGDCMMELTDILWLASYLFLGGEPPVPGCE